MKFRNYIVANIVIGFLVAYLFELVLNSGSRRTYLVGRDDLVQLVIPSAIVWLVFVLVAELSAQIKIKIKQRYDKDINFLASLALGLLGALLFSALFAVVLIILYAYFNDEKTIEGNFFIISYVNSIYFSIFMVLNVIYQKYQDVKLRDVGLDISYACLLALPTMFYVYIILLLFYIRRINFLWGALANIFIFEGSRWWR